MKFVIVLLISIIGVCVAEREVDCSDPNWHSLETKYTELNCGAVFQNRCHCHRACYDGHHQYIVNCTNSDFTDTSPLAHLPNNTQILIFTGNSIPQLPWNVFGDMDNLPHLRVIDMSNNQISEIPGKAYHHVKNVERLILDFNELSVNPTRNHPRLFSNFESLLELHLTDAFEDGPPRSLAETLHDIFVNSNLTHLMKLHLEQNEISQFHEKRVFCDLPSLLDLHLGDNDLNELRFDMNCLRKLRFLDLQRNKFTRVLERDLQILDSFPARNQSLTVDFYMNPFECSCKLNPFVRWMQRTKVLVRNKGLLKCKEKDNSWSLIYEVEDCDLVERSKILQFESYSNSKRTDAPTVLLYILSLLLVILVFALIYVQRKELQKKLGPVLDTVHKRVHYTSISTRDNREVDA